MKNAISKFILLAALLLMIGSCKKKSIDEETTINHQVDIPVLSDTVISSHLLSDYLFNPGTFWVYRDSATGVTDTCVVDSVLFFNGVTLTYVGVYYYKYARNLTNIDCPCNYFLTGDQVYLIYSYPFHASNVLLDSVDINGNFYMINGCTFFPVYYIDTTSYLSVYKLFFELTATDLPDSGYCYLKAGIGVIRSETYKDGVKTVSDVIGYNIY